MESLFFPDPKRWDQRNNVLGHRVQALVGALLLTFCENVDDSVLGSASDPKVRLTPVPPCS